MKIPQCIVSETDLFMRGRVLEQGPEQDFHMQSVTEELGFARVSPPAQKHNLEEANLTLPPWTLLRTQNTENSNEN